MNKEALSSDPYPGTSGLSSITAPQLTALESWQALANASDLFLKSLTFGRVRGVANLYLSPDDTPALNSGYVQLICELIKRDILVALTCPETAGKEPPALILPDLFDHTGDGLAEFCSFIGILPVLNIDNEISRSDMLDFYSAVSQQAGVKTPDLPVAEIKPESFENPAQTSDAVFTMTGHPENTADLIDLCIHEKRLAIQWCDRCGGCFSPFS